jgi:hypothetical protein
MTAAHNPDAVTPVFRPDQKLYSLVREGGGRNLRRVCLKPRRRNIIRRRVRACFIVRKKNGQALGYFCLEDEPGRRAAAKLLTRTRHGAWRRTSPSCRAIKA